MSIPGIVMMGSSELSNKTVVFLGVSTGKSSVLPLFSAWSRSIGVTAGLTGVDLAIGSPREAYEEFITSTRSQVDVVGALVTSHKAKLYSACRDHFVERTDACETLREIGCFRQCGGLLAADAQDLVTSGIACERLLQSENWKQGSRHVVVFGAGGAGLALAVNLGKLSDGPTSIRITEISRGRRAEASEILSRAGLGTRIELMDACDSDKIMAASPRGTLFVNATGMGKDIEGSPVAGFGAAPKRSLVWDFNYRGGLEFLKLARLHEKKKELLILDGWDYFVAGWTYVICWIFRKEVTAEVEAGFREIAQRYKLA